MQASHRLAIGIGLMSALSLGTACGPDRDPQFASQGATVELPGPPGGAPLRVDDATEPHPIAGVDLDSLTNREKRTWWRFVSSLYSPCSDQAVSIVQCVDEKRPCGGCGPAAQLLAAKIKEGATGDQIQTLYAERFGPSTKQVDLSGSPSKGPENAPVTIVEWFDFECPHCKLALPILAELEKAHEKEVRLVKKFYPISHHDRALPAARAAIAAMAQGKYWEMEGVLFKNQKALEDADLERYATEIGLDLARFKTDLQSEKTEALLKRDHDEAERDGLQGTPFILINGHEFDLAFFHLESDLQPWIATEIAMKKK